MAQRLRRCDSSAHKINWLQPLRCPLQFESREPEARAIVKDATHFNDPKVLLEVSEDLTGAMKGLAVAGLNEAQMLQTRGW